MMKQEWWMPLEAEGELDWLCDHLGDASEVMAKMWKQICKDHPDLPTNGFNNNDDII